MAPDATHAHSHGVFRRHRRHGLAALAGAVALEALAAWLRSGKPGGNLIVRCRHGHLYTTIWIPGASVKSLRLGWWRYQRCPVGRHFSIVTPVRESRLSEREQRSARSNRDVRIP